MYEFRWDKTPQDVLKAVIVWHAFWIILAVIIISNMEGGVFNRRVQYYEVQVTAEALREKTDKALIGRQDGKEVEISELTNKQKKFWMSYAEKLKQFTTAGAGEVVVMLQDMEKYALYGQSVYPMDKLPRLTTYQREYLEETLHYTFDDFNSFISW